MAKRRYHEEETAKKAMMCETVPRMPTGESAWEKRERRTQALQIAQALSEPGSNAEDVIADARKYANYLAGE